MLTSMCYIKFYLNLSGLSDRDDSFGVMFTKAPTICNSGMYLDDPLTSDYKK